MRIGNDRLRTELSGHPEIVHVLRGQDKCLLPARAVAGPRYRPAMRRPTTSNSETDAVGEIGTITRG
jgi:hypothetical protein